MNGVTFVFSSYLKEWVPHDRTIRPVNVIFSLDTTLNKETTFHPNRHFLRQKLTEIRFWFDLNRYIIIDDPPNPLRDV